VLATQIRTAAEEVSESLSNRAMDSRRTGVTYDDISSAMMEYLREVEDVWQLPGGVPLAFDLVMDLARYSHDGLGDGDSRSCGFGDRPSDPEVDSLLSALAKIRKEEEPSWNYMEVVESLKMQKKHLAAFGINGFCSNSIVLLSGWEKPASEIVDLTID
ncbi:MAG: hypothetical protein Q9224_003840, partial [Gallowayella concinna]